MDASCVNAADFIYHPIRVRADRRPETLAGHGKQWDAHGNVSRIVAAHCRKAYYLKILHKEAEQQPAACHFTYAVTTAAKACEMPAVLLHLGKEGGFLLKPRTVHLYVSTCSLQALKQLSRRNKRLSCQKPLR